MQKREEWDEHIAQCCDATLCLMERQDAEYKEFVQRRILLSEIVKPFMDTDEEMAVPYEMQRALREFIKTLLIGHNMEEMIACYKCGFGDALHILIETGALPNQQ